MRSVVVAGLAVRAWTELLLRSPLQVRHLRRWVSTILATKRQDTVLWDALPWFVFDALREIEAAIGPEANVFEWGTGVSTIWLARRVANVVSVEHDPTFLATVRRALGERGLHNCHLELRELDGDDPAAQREAYAATIDGFEDDSFDLVIIDGRARTCCAAHAMRKVAPGGILLLDNADRPYYQEAFDRLAAWPRQDYFGPGPYIRTFWQTSIWRRPPVDTAGVPVREPAVPVVIDWQPNRVASESARASEPWNPSNAGRVDAERPDLDEDQRSPRDAGLSARRAAPLEAPDTGEPARDH